MVKTREQEVEHVLDMIRPALALDMGDIKLVKVEDDTVYLELLGACSTCPVPDITMKDVIIVAIKNFLPWVKKVQIGQHKFDISTL
ncbi:NifU family protein [Persephonella atlantica]|uniref:NifU family protein n=1 Tax=Persephonella atlantica TaxID=2699429 RepID=A0ABS1GFN5_9AQUI|nr:NifU family protein [Persephonella atlantica]MBK3331728.1 NifU family protein [Persephonella atlantica]